MSGPLTFNTPDRIIRDALRNAGKLQKGVDPDSQTLSDCMDRLNDLINLRQTEGLKLWLNYDLPITLTVGQTLYSMGPAGTIAMTKPLRVVLGYYTDPYGNSRPLNALSQQEYKGLSNLTNQGAINSYYVDKQQLSLNVYLWLAPDTTAATGTVHLIIQQQVTNLVQLTDDMNFPQEWFMYLHWGLGYEVCTGQPQAVIDRCEKMSTMYLEILEDQDVEDADTTFTPDPRMSFDTGAFK